ncbi:MAG: hypothetical protein AXA67_08640 [Methylothermaceae bacteria B42]|nr:MAG: hypothetical protein AXA67_08640 [Methylothermaceae bacteria B42]
MSQRYSDAFKEQAISKVLQRGDKTIQCIADELERTDTVYITWSLDSDKSTKSTKPIYQGRWS